MKWVPGWNESPSAWYRAAPWYVRAYYSWGLLLVLVVTLAGCGQPTPIVLTPPPALLTCKPAPEVPATLPAQGTVERDAVTVGLWLAEREAGADCRAAVAGVARWVDEVGD